ncbi:MAG TPA: DUF1269 domain-containing protein [Steroidobacteraceae bacterium]|nr:DUF1269 domain-containing protein [Steroidobacteraceae bacterium]
MDKLVAVVFKDEKTAYQGVQAFAEMNAEGSVDVAAVCVIKKELDGRLVTRDMTDFDFPIRTVVGTTLGALIGILAGPAGVAAGAAAGTAAAGAAVGAASGMFAGAIGDLYNAGVDEDFMSDVATALTPGKCAVIAEVEEEWVTPLDTRMEALGGVVYRTVKSTVQEEQWKRERAAAKAELEQLKIEHAKAQADRKAKLQTQIENLNKRIEAKLARAQARSQQEASEYEAKVKALQQKAEKQKGEAKAAVEARIAKLRKDFQSRPHAQG